MDTAEILKKVRKIEIKTKGLSKHIFSGEYHSAFKGRGMSFSEVRDYQYGDDVRNIDWNVTARTGDPFVKVFEEERELTVFLLIDMSGSAYYGSGKQFKIEIMTEIAAVLAFSAINNNDKVGAIIFTDQIEHFIPPKKGKKHILRIIRELIYSKPKGRGTNLELALQYFNNVQKKRCISFLISDFMTQGYERALSIAARRHDIIGIHLYDDNEKELPAIGILETVHAETDERVLIDTNDPRQRRKYAAWFNENAAYFRNEFTKNGLDAMTISTEVDYVKALLKFFKRRSK